MEDCSACPICNSKLKVSNKDDLYLTNKVSSKIEYYSEKVCNGTNHHIQIYVDKLTNKVGFIRFSLNPKYSKYLEIDYVNGLSTILLYLQNDKGINLINTIEIPRILEIDFPDLTNLNKIISVYTTFF